MGEISQVNVTAVNLNSQTVDQILQCNYTAAFILGSVCNLLLIYLILRRSPNSLRPYCPILLIAAFADGFSILVFGLDQLDMRILDDLGLFILKGPSKHLSEFGQYFTLGLFAVCLNLEVLIMLLETWFRYQFVKTKTAMPLKQLLIYLLIFLLISLFQLPTFVSNYVFFRETDNNYRLLWPQNDPDSRVLIIRFADNWFYHLAAIEQTVVPFACFLLSIFIAVWSIRVMKENVVNMSKKTKDLLSQFTKIIVMRMVLFGSTNLLPLFIVQVTRYLSINGANLNVITLVLYSWLPVLNTIFCISCIKPYRKTLFQLSPRLFSPPSETFVTRVQSVS